MDVASLKCDFPQSIFKEALSFLSASRPQDNWNWVGAGFAYAGGDSKHGKPRLVNVLGKVHSAADQDPQFEVGAEFPPDIEEGWQGISGNPVFVHGRIIGVIVACPANFLAQRLRATPDWKLLEDPAFSKAAGYDDQLERRRNFEQRIAQTHKATRQDLFFSDRRARRGQGIRPGPPAPGRRQPHRIAGSVMVFRCNRAIGRGAIARGLGR